MEAYKVSKIREQSDICEKVIYQIMFRTFTVEGTISSATRRLKHVADLGVEYGQKSSEYDRFNYLATDGSISSSYTSGAKSIMGGTVIPLSSSDGSLKKPYILYV